MREIAVVLVAASSALVSGQTGARASSLPLASDMPVIEHAEIILGPDGTKDRAFLTIWNGTPEEKSITGLRIAGYGRIALVQAGRTQVDRYTSDIDDMVLTVPSNSEMYMKPNTLFFSIERVGELPGTVEIEVEIDNRYTIKSIAALKPTGLQHYKPPPRRSQRPVRLTARNASVLP